MLRKIESELRNFKIGDEKSKVGKWGTWNISVSQASQAVGNHFIKNFFARLKLFFGVGQWLNNENIEGRLSQLEPVNLHRLNILFTLSYPDERKVSDKKILKLINQFVRPQIYESSLKLFFSGANPKDCTIPEDKKSLNHIVKLVEAGISLKELSYRYKLNPSGILSLIEENTTVQRIFADYGLTAEYAKQLENFATQPILQTELFRFLPHRAKDNLAKLLNAGVADEAYARFIKADATPDEIPQIILKNLENTPLLAEFLYKLPDSMPPEKFPPDILAALQTFSPSEAFQGKLFRFVSEEELKNLIALTTAKITAEEFASFILGESDPEKNESIAIENLRYADTVEQCVEVFIEKKFSQEMTEIFFVSLDNDSKTEDNRRLLEIFFLIPPFAAEEKQAFLDSNDPRLAENILYTMQSSENIDRSLNYHHLKKFLSSHPNIAQSPVEALTTRFEILKKELKNTF